MKRSALQCAVGFLGATLIVVGVVWTCRQLSSPTQLNAAQVTPVSGQQQPMTKRPSGSLSLSLSSSPESHRPHIESKPLPKQTPTKIRPTSGALSLSVVDSEDTLELESPSSFENFPDPLESLEEPIIEEPIVASHSEENSGVSDDNNVEYLSPSSFPYAELSNELDVIDTTTQETSYAVQQEVSSTLSLNDCISQENDAFEEANDVYSSDLSLNDEVPPQEELSDNIPSAIEPLNDESYAPSDASVERLDSLSNFETSETLVEQTPTEIPAVSELPQETAPTPIQTVDQLPRSNEAIPGRQPNSFSQPQYNTDVKTYAQSNRSSGSNLMAALFQYVKEDTVSAAIPNDNFSGAQTVQITVEKQAPAEVTVGKQTTFTITVKNTGVQESKNLILRDSVPEGAQLISCTDNITPDARGELVWPKFSLPPQSEKTFEYTIVPVREGQIGSVATIMTATSASAFVMSAKPELKVQVEVPEKVELGQVVSFNIIITNVGNGVANSVKLNENIPQGLSHPSGNFLSQNIGTLNAGESKSISLGLNAEAQGISTNKLTVTAEGCEAQVVETPVKVVAPALEVAIDGPEKIYLERTATYTLSIKNVGDSPALDVQLVAQLPSGVEFISANNLGAYRKNDHCVYWDLTELPAQNHADITLSVKTIEASQSELVFKAIGPKNLSAETKRPISIDGLAALTFNVTSSTDLVEVGKEFEYTIQIENRGTKASNNVLLKVLPPAAIKILASDGPTKPVVRQGIIEFNKLGAINPKSSVVYKLKASPTVGGDCRVEFQLSSDDLEPLTKEENTRVYQ